MYNYKKQIMIYRVIDGEEEYDKASYKFFPFNDAWEFFFGWNPRGQWYWTSRKRAEEHAASVGGKVTSQLVDRKDVTIIHNEYWVDAVHYYTNVISNNEPDTDPDFANLYEQGEYEREIYHIFSNLFSTRAWKRRVAVYKPKSKVTCGFCGKDVEIVRCTKSSIGTICNTCRTMLTLCPDRRQVAESLIFGKVEEIV